MNDNPNVHIETYLDHYLSKPKPGFAVLITAPWGSGKTDYIRNWRSEKGRPSSISVSLFGIRNREEFDRAVSLSRIGKGIVGLSSLSKWVPPFISKEFQPSITLAEIGQIDTPAFPFPDLIIFDDLERAVFEPKELLGAINQYVEIKERHVIILVNDEKLWSTKEVEKSELEKLVGKTLRLKARPELAIEHFIKPIDGPAKDFLNSQKDVVLKCFAASGYENLRFLRQGVQEFARLYSVLDDDNRNADGCLRDFLCLYLALSMGAGARTVKRNDILTNFATDFTGMFNDPNEPSKVGNTAAKEIQKYVAIENKFLSFGFDNSAWPIGPITIAEAIFDGKIQSDSINADFTSYIRKNKVTELEILNNWYHQDVDDLKNAAVTLEDNIRNCTYKEINSTISALSCFLCLPELKLTTNSIGKQLCTSRSYIKNLYSQHPLPRELVTAPTDRARLPTFIEDCFPDSKKACEAAKRYFSWQQKKALDLFLKQQAKDFLERMKTDMNPLFEMNAMEMRTEVCLAKIDVQEYVETILDLPRYSQIMAFELLLKFYRCQRDPDDATALNALADEVERRLSKLSSVQGKQLEIDLSRFRGDLR